MCESALTVLYADMGGYLLLTKELLEVRIGR